MAATTSATFVIFLEFSYADRDKRAEEITVQNAATVEQLAVRNGISNKPHSDPINYVEVLRHPTADANVRDWVNGWAYYGSKYKFAYEDYDEAERVISVAGPFTIG